MKAPTQAPLTPGNYVNAAFIVTLSSSPLPLAWDLQGGKTKLKKLNDLEGMLLISAYM